MQEPKIATPRTLTVAKGGRAGPAGREPATVRLVDLRTLEHHDTGHGDAEGGRVYRHRWIVRGHWRQQATGPGRAARVPTYIAPHVKGPAGAPLLATEHVLVWRR